MENSNDTIGNRTRDLPAFSAVPQPTAPLHVPKICYYEIAFSYRDPNWNLNDYIRWLRQELKSWRHMYWRLWGDCHFLYCGACHNYFPVYQMQWCCHHPDAPQFFTMEHQPTMTYPTGRFPCCGERAYRFEVLSNKLVSVIIILNKGCGHVTNIFDFFLFH